MTKRFAVIGNPIAHSRSPELHSVFAEKMRIDLMYTKILATIDNFEKTVRDFFADGGTGLNVTVPFKEQAFVMCDHLTEHAKIAKAVNILWMQNNKLYGDNTDGHGLVSAIQTLGWDLQKSSILILGAGGATRGVIHPLVQSGARQIVIANRTLSKAEQLIQDMRLCIPLCEFSAISLEQLTGKFDFVINATSASLSGEILILPESLTFRHAYEMTYGKPSSFLNTAKQRGIPCADGYSMLVGQAIEAFYIWHGKRPNLQDFTDGMH